MIRLTIDPTTGSEFEITLDPDTTVEELKKLLATRLKVGREVISLLYRESLLTEGTLSSHGLETGSTVRLVPCIETGILTPRPEQSVLEALEALNEAQVADFLSGKSPLNLTMRLGEHVMLIQLQLSKSTPPSVSVAPTSSPAASTSTAAATGTPVAGLSGSSSSSVASTPASMTASVASSSSSPAVANLKKANLSEASRSLTNTLKKLSHTVSSTGTNETESAVHKQLHHHGKGVYSGTFSGTLNPTLQDGQGKPRKHVSTIVHILNDLLGNMDLKSAHQSSSSSSSGSVKRKSTSTAQAQPSKATKLAEREVENKLLACKVSELREKLRTKNEARMKRHNLMS